jgi:(E)-4-hydroxy-3-methylbut-2-enyl-diphosphate synthase
MTDVGFTGGGRGTHQVYIKGLPDHRLKDDNIVDHLVGLVEARAAEIEAAQAREEGAAEEAAAEAAAAEGSASGGKITAAAS